MDGNRQIPSLHFHWSDEISHLSLEAMEDAAVESVQEHYRHLKAQGLNTRSAVCGVTADVVIADGFLLLYLS